MVLPKEANWIAVKRIFKYLKATKDVAILYRHHCQAGELEIYTDAGEVMSRSTSGVVTLYAEGTISLRSERQRSKLFPRPRLNLSQLAKFLYQR